MNKDKETIIMKRDKKFNARYSEEDEELANSLCEKYNISKSELLRRMLIDFAENATIDTKDMAHHIFNMQCIIDKIMNYDSADEDYDVLEKEMNAIWQSLN